jgi:rhomboid family GlyGly-CTERM serine protease
LKQIPIVTPLLALLAGALMFLPASQKTLLFLDLGGISEGHLLGFISGHWMHADPGHLLWNVAAFAILGALIERHSRALLFCSLAIGTLCVDLLLLSPFSDIQRYCGLSGVLNTLLGVSLYLSWRRTRSGLVILVGLLSIMKIVIEIRYGHSLFTDISWPPFPLAHLVGLLATPVAILFFQLSRMPEQGLARPRKPSA